MQQMRRTRDDDDNEYNINDANGTGSDIHGHITAVTSSSASGSGAQPAFRSGSSEQGSSPRSQFMLDDTISPQLIEDFEARKEAATRQSSNVVSSSSSSALSPSAIAGPGLRQTTLPFRTTTTTTNVSNTQPEQSSLRQQTANRAQPVRASTVIGTTLDDFFPTIIRDSNTESGRITAPQATLSPIVDPELPAITASTVAPIQNDDIINIEALEDLWTDSLPNPAQRPSLSLDSIDSHALISEHIPLPPSSPTQSPVQPSVSKPEQISQQQQIPQQQQQQQQLSQYTQYNENDFLADDLSDSELLSALGNDFDETITAQRELPAVEVEELFSDSHTDAPLPSAVDSISAQSVNDNNATRPSESISLYDDDGDDGDNDNDDGDLDEAIIQTTATAPVIILDYTQQSQSLMNTINNDGNEAEKEKEEEEDYDDDDDDDFMVVETNRSPANTSNSRKRPHPIATPVTINEVNGDGNGDEDDDDDDFAVVSTNFNEKEVQEQERERKRRQAEKDGLDDIMNYAAVTVLPLSGIASTKCVVCLDVPTPAVCTPCGHIFCETCILNSVSQLGNCPVCRKKLSNSKGLRVLQFSTAPGRIVTLPSAVS